jgi:hypothetical protein
MGQGLLGLLLVLLHLLLRAASALAWMLHAP